ncbi:RNA polymerase subunit sigma-70 [Propionibacteriaceae bacterium Y1700]|uniref:RNA polymerase subunit sigma-70 n=1 Tax=Microlunatus sp. Y1700 TaxID=3418487 RepID=UPI003DA77AD2
MSNEQVQQWLADARAGDADAFGRLAEHHRAELVLHAYRMLGRLDDAEDAVQDAVLRAWQAVGSFRGDASVRTWLHRLTTNVCLDRRATAERRRSLLARTAVDQQVVVPIAGTVPWVQAVPDALLDAVDTINDSHDDRVTSRETVEIGFIAALQHLPDRQRAVFLLRDTVGWSAKETAAELEMSVSAANAALHRARTTMRDALGEREEWSRPATTAMEDKVVSRWITAIETGDDEAIANLVSDDVVVSHQPLAGQDTAQIGWYAGRTVVIEAWAPALHATPSLEMKLLPVRVNRQPGLASYIRSPDAPGHHAFGLEILRIVPSGPEAGRVAEVINLRSDQFEQLGLPLTLPENPTPEEKTHQERTI